AAMYAGPTGSTAGASASKPCGRSHAAAAGSTAWAGARSRSPAGDVWRAEAGRGSGRRSHATAPAVSVGTRTGVVGVVGAGVPRGGSRLVWPDVGIGGACGPPSTPGAGAAAGAWTFAVPAADTTGVPSAAARTTVTAYGP